MTNPTDRPKIVTLCGSTRFRHEFELAAKNLGLAGIIVLTVACFGHDGDLPPEALEKGHPLKDRLDELHKRKIDLSDEILVINLNGYIGDSTRGEIEYALRQGKPVHYWEGDGQYHAGYQVAEPPPKPHTLLDACLDIIHDSAIMDRYPKGIQGHEIMAEIWTKYGPDTFSLCTTLDVNDELKAYYG